MFNKISSLKNNKGFIKYFKNTSWLFSEKIIRLAVGLLVGIWVARYLGPERFGLYSYAQSFVGLFATIATLGLNGIIVRELVKDETLRDDILGTGFYLKIMGSLIVLILLAIAIQFTSNDQYTNILVFIIASATIFQSFNVIDFYFQSKVLSRYVVYANIISLLLSSIVKILLIIYNAPLITFAFTVLFDSFVLACGLIYFYIRHATFKIWHLKFNKRLALSLLKDSWPLVLSGVIISIYMKIDQVMIKEMLDSQAVGQYTAAVKLSEAWYFIPMVIASSLFPAIINAKEKSLESYYYRLQKLYDLMVWSAVFIALPMTFLSDWLINILYGKQFFEAGGVLMIHIWASVFVFLGVVGNKWYIIENLQKYSFYRSLTGGIINIIMNYILIPIYGIYGAAISTLISQAIASYFFNVTNSKLQYNFLLQTNAILLPFRMLGVKFK